jgi:hypothetical protein
LDEIAGTIVGGAGNTSAFARLILLQSAQKSCARPAGAFCRGDAGPPTALLGAPAEIAAVPATPITVRCTWPKVNTNWQASANNASQASLPAFDLNHLIDRGPASDDAEHSTPRPRVKRIANGVLAPSVSGAMRSDRISQLPAVHPTARLPFPARPDNPRGCASQPPRSRPALFTADGTPFARSPQRRLHADGMEADNLRPAAKTT